jgi:preprotein translocase subunit SecD
MVSSHFITRPPGTDAEATLRRSIPAIVAALIATVALADDTLDVGALTLEFHLLEDRDSAETFTAPLRGTTETMIVNRRGLLDLADFDRVRVLAGTPENVSLGFQLTVAGTRKFREITAGSIGRQFAILVNREIVMIPMILDENRTGRGFLRNLTAAEAQAIAARVGREIESGHYGPSTTPR